MTATLLLYYSNGATPTENNVDAASPNLRFRTDDDADTVDATSPIPIPTAGTKYSYWIHVYLQASVAPTSYVNNVKIFGDGGYWTGTTLYTGDETPTHTSVSTAGYDQASGTAGDTGDELVANHTNITGSTDFSTFVTGSPKSVSISEASSQIDAIGETTDYVVFQLNVVTGASAGDAADETVTWRYDEV